MKHQIKFILCLALVSSGCATAPRVSKVFRPDKLAEMDAAIKRPSPTTNVPAACCGWSATARRYHKAYGARASCPNARR